MPSKDSLYSVATLCLLSLKTGLKNYERGSLEVRTHPYETVVFYLTYLI